LKTKQTSLSLMEDEIVKEEHKVLDGVVNRTEEQSNRSTTLYPYPLVGRVEEIYNHGLAKVSFVIEKQTYEYEAMTTQPLNEAYEKRACMISFNQGELSQPIVTGIIQSQEAEPLVISSQEGIILECGDTRIALDEYGTLDLKAQHINSQAYGPYRIKGGSVKIN